ncbi:hypothetical protein LTR10_022718 [Elasticomyces elasticus]|uniref:Transcription factor domain-containing protein n=1 Tax=Exophiala sideris TaxID=1016849 RepID=A0ABR0IVI6_9EURO|nr:hypothetical protein LTR10_022718 [Elasticomyces elasticus]KAK5021494.1 hypothetical protein LTS07_011003 [Exophiala sideris]KAK5024483.1 hypothetical protein LTR13_010844 [Exophiala sideris]KAK5049626.1 hypothetical protein LTR69_011027 [Exophiala sideris]KAK5176579.1 hypothetical protein LTR44_010865 [Eurotiomycetes sp. CCFEE 6388]
MSQTVGNASVLVKITPTFALQQCNLAVNFLVAETNPTTNKAVILTSCVLFMAFEMMQDSLESVLSLLDIGLRILGKWRSNGQETATMSEKEVVESCLSPILSRFGGSSDLTDDIYGSPSPLLAASTKTIRHVTLMAPPETFLSLTHAATCLHSLLDQVFADLPQSHPESFTEKLRLGERGTSILDAWHNRFRHFLGHCPSKTNKATCRRLCLVELQYFAAKVLHAALIFDDQMVYDNYTHFFQNIIKLCRSVIELDSASNGSTAPRMSFSFDLGIIMPLSFVAKRCRDPVIRRTALDPLLDCPRREGIWLSWMTGQVAEQIISIEEDGIIRPETCNDVPSENRIHLLEMYYNPCAANLEDNSRYFTPLLRLQWLASLCQSGFYSEEIRQRTLQPPATTDRSPGHRPYWVTMPHGATFSHWKLLLGKKTFRNPDAAYTAT